MMYCHNQHNFVKNERHEVHKEMPEKDTKPRLNTENEKQLKNRNGDDPTQVSHFLWHSNRDGVSSSPKLYWD